jgi:hypothetical protein
MNCPIVLPTAEFDIMAKSHSFGLQVGDEQPPAYERLAGSLETDFKDAHRDYVPLELEDEGSQMIADDGQFHDMHPDQSIREQQDRATFEQKWEAEHDRAREQFLERYAAQLDSAGEQPQEHAHDRDRDNELSL